MRGIDYHRLYFRHRFFPSIFVVLSTLQGLETHRERPVSSFFFFLFPSLLFSPSPTRRFPFASKWKHTYLAAFVPSLFPFVFGRAGNGRSLYSRIRTRICASVSRSRRPPLPFIRFLLLFSVSRTEPTMKKRQAISPCAIPNVRTYSNVSTWFSSSRQRSCFHREL